MAWHFFDFGLLMPAATPMDKADIVFTEDKYDFQIRGRVESHLRYFMDTFMEAGTFHDDIEFTPGMDYNVRFYTTREAYADAVRLAILAIDYKKFKPAAERKNEDGTLKFKGGILYHSVLNSIWSSVTRLGAPGGMWSSAKAYGSYRSSGYPKFSSSYVPDKGLDLYKGNSRHVGDSFFRDEELDDWTGDYTPDVDTRIGDLLSELSGIPADQWEDYLTEAEYELMKPFKNEARQNEARMARTVRKVSKKNSRNGGYRRSRHHKV